MRYAIEVVTLGDYARPQAVAELVASMRQHRAEMLARVHAGPPR